MRTRDRLALLIAPALMLMVGIGFLFLSWKFEQNAGYRQMNFPIIEKRAKELDARAKMPEESNLSASALVRVLAISEEAQTDYRGLIRLAGLLMLLFAVIQVLALIPVLRTRKPPNATAETDVRKRGKRGSP